MTTLGPSSHASTATSRRAAVRVALRSVSMETRLAIGLGLFSVTVAIGVTVLPEVTPFTSLMLPVVLGSIFLGPRTLPWFVLFDLALLGYCVAQQDVLTTRTVGAISVQVLIALVVLVTGFRRARLGVAGLRGETMFVDLRDRILNQGRIPTLPEGWAVDSALHSAGGTKFAGDFVVASRSGDGRSLHLVLVDVSGKGEAAGTRALLLSGAFGGLLAALPADGFLPAANDYLMRQDWDEGFATAVHLFLDLETGDYRLWTAGHPPAAHRSGETDRWHVLRSDGPVLGLVHEAVFTGEAGQLGCGDAVLLYTDGMVEARTRDIDLGLDLLLDEADRDLRTGQPGTAERLATMLGARDDDRAVIVVQRA